MTGTDIATACGGIGIVLGQIAAIILAVRGIARSKENGLKIDDNRAVMEAQAEKINEIHSQTGVLAAGKFTPGATAEPK